MGRERHRLPELPGKKLPEAATRASARGGGEAGPILPKVLTSQREEGHQGTSPSTYLMLKPVVWSSLSQLCSFASSLCKDTEGRTQSIVPPSAPVQRLHSSPAVLLHPIHHLLCPTHRAPIDPHTRYHHDTARGAESEASLCLRSLPVPLS